MKSYLLYYLILTTSRIYKINFMNIIFLYFFKDKMVVFKTYSYKKSEKFFKFKPLTYINSP